MNLQSESATMNKIAPPSCINWQTGSDEQNSWPTFTLDELGFIREFDKSVETLFGYGQHELVWQHISCLFPKLTEFALMKGNRLNPLLNHICHDDYEYEAINKQGGIMKYNLSFTLVEHEGVLTIRLIVRSVTNSYS
jgi:PAS domain S-box-containing protein